MAARSEGRIRLVDAVIFSFMAPATVVNSSAEVNNGAAPTAERASRNATSYGFTTRNRVQPKLAMARAAAPMFNGFRGATSTTRRSPSKKKFAVEMSRCIFFLTFNAKNLIKGTQPRSLDVRRES